ncbi:hypothetical protein GCM10009624_28750 [Gordonia sinesedis]
MALAWNAGWVNSPQGFESPILRRRKTVCYLHCCRRQAVFRSDHATSETPPNAEVVRFRRMNGTPKARRRESWPKVTVACALAAGVTALIAVVGVAFAEKWSASRVGPLVTSASALVTLSALAFAWHEARQATRTAEDARKASARAFRLTSEYQRRQSGLLAVAQLTAIAQSMHSNRTNRYFASAGKVGGEQIANDLQTLVHSATPYSMMINTSHTGQAALRGFGNAQSVLSGCPAPGDDPDLWLALGKTWNLTANWMMTRIPLGTAEFSTDPEHVEQAVDGTKPPGVRYTWELGADDRPPLPPTQAE